ncbi:YadA-like family protein [Negativicoccus succinicivorans]|uniref:YadA-like family protein n=1 Tax=Negativicoccus succinicivorans TaxID=620903 RepID=UPI00235245A6|nr:YadA-like family protein [Negativicoccus succinicivorans]MDU0987072.1 YadA-like family protein [Negativicoccus succinicivorans]MDU1066485.1 YadA-like family protein [Negativicoccus succinicivorans]
MSKIQKIVRSESVKSRAKNSSREGLRRSVTAALFAALVAAPVAFGVYAADGTPYVSVTSDQKAAGSNYNSDGAKADDSMVIGIGSTSEGINSTVIGKNNTLTGTKHLRREGKEVEINNSIVAGHNLEVDGYCNSVLATDYEDDTFHGLTKVAGDYNTVLGAGNVVGYALEDKGKDYIYTKLDENIISNNNVVIGTRQTVSGSDNVVIGDLTTFEVGADQVTTVGIGNRIGSEAREGVAIGNHLGINGYQTVAIGFGSEANAESAIAFGSYSFANAESAISIGNGSSANAKNSVAIGGPLVTEGAPVTEGSGALATVENGVALGSGSVADREAGVAGYLSNGKTTAEWQSTLGSVSVGVVSDEFSATRQITGVAAGTENTDAVNVAQLKALESTVNDGMTVLDTRITTNTEKITELGGRIGTLDTRVDRVGAGAAALAALHPLDYDPENKWDFAAGYGNYSGANAVAIGAFYRPNENQMFSISGSFGGGENMVNAGISVKVGEGTGISTSKVAMANEIKNLKIANEKVQQENKEMKNEIEILKQQVQKLMAGK